jgi:subtilisin family serine protease
MVLADGYDFIDNDGVPSDSANGIDEDLDGQLDEGAGHGTMVSGIIHLVAPGASILPVRVLDDEGHGTTFSVAKGIRYAVAHGAKVINLSLGLARSSHVIGYEIDQARQASVALVAAAGNSGADSLILYPASDSHVLMVAGLDSVDVKAPFSSYNHDVAVSAPSIGIYSPYYDGGYAIGAGTSFATPFISAECALVLALDPGLGTDQVYDRIRQGVVDVYSIPENAPYTGSLGTGRFDALEMLQISPMTAGAPVAGPVGATLRLAPNPVMSGGGLGVSWSSPVPGTARLLIHDAAGRQLRSLVTSGERGLDLLARGDDGRPLPPGAYFVRVQTPGGAATAKLIVVR